MLAETLASISIIAVIVLGIKSWGNSRVIHDIQRMKFAIDPGDSRADEEKVTDEKFRKKLASGKWTIITSYPLRRNDDYDYNYNVFVLGKVKK